MTTAVSRPASGADPVLTDLIEAFTNKLQAGDPVDVDGYVRQSLFEVGMSAD